MPWIDDAPNQPSPWGEKAPAPLKEEDAVAAAEQAVAEDTAAITRRPACEHLCVHGNSLSGKPPRCCVCKEEVGQ